MAPDEFPLPYEYRFIQIENLVTEPPADLEERTIVFLDCGNIDRNPADSLKREGAHILNVDHHHDNTQFGTVNLVVPEASCTAEVIWDLIKDLGAELTRPIAEALYVGLVTDTGKFMYENTGPPAHRMAAELIEAGVDVHAIYRRIFEGVPQGKLELLARGLANVERFDDGLLTRHPPELRGLRRHRRRRVLLRGRRRPPARARGHRGRRPRPRPPRQRRAAAQGVAARHRRPRRRLRDRALPGRWRPSPRRRLLDHHGLPAAGRGPAGEPGRAALSPDGVILYDKPAGITSHDVVARVRRRLGKGVKVGHAGTLDPFATGLLLVLVGRATRVQRFLMALPKRYETVAQLGWTSTTGDIDGELAPGRTPAEPFALPTGVIRQRPPAYSAVKVGGKRAYALARAGEAVELAEREVEVTRFEQLWREDDRAAFAIECSSGTYVRSLIADLGDAYCVELRRTGIGPFEVGEADPEKVHPPQRRAGASCLPRSLPPEDAAQGRPRRGRARRGGGHRQAGRRGRPHRPRRAARGRHPQARRRLPRLMASPGSPTSRPARAMSRWGSSTASTSATAR